MLSTMTTSARNPKNAVRERRPPRTRLSGETPVAECLVTWSPGHWGAVASQLPGQRACRLHNPKCTTYHTPRQEIIDAMPKDRV